MVLRHSGRVGSRRFDWSFRTWRSSGGFFLYPHVWNVTSTVFSAQFENLGELVKNLIFPVGVDTFPTELSGRLRHVFSPAGAGPETLTGTYALE